MGGVSTKDFTWCCHKYLLSHCYCMIYLKKTANVFIFLNYSTDYAKRNFFKRSTKGPSSII